MYCPEAPEKGLRCARHAQEKGEGQGRGQTSRISDDGCRVESYGSCGCAHGGIVRCSLPKGQNNVDFHMIVIFREDATEEQIQSALRKIGTSATHRT